jgi:hypothetical protein
MELNLKEIWPDANQVDRAFIHDEKKICPCFLSENVFDKFYSDFVENIPRNPPPSETITLKEKDTIFYAIDDDAGLIFLSFNLYTANFCNDLQAIDNNFRMYHKVTDFLTCNQPAVAVIKEITKILCKKDYPIILFDQDKVKKRTENILSLCAKKKRKRERTLNNLTAFYVKLSVIEQYIAAVFNNVKSDFGKVYTLTTVLELNKSDIKIIENTAYIDKFKYVPLELFFWLTDYFKKNQEIQKQIIEEFNTIKTSGYKNVIITIPSKEIFNEDIRKVFNLTFTTLYYYYLDFPTVFDKNVSSHASSNNSEKKLIDSADDKEKMSVSNINSPLPSQNSNSFKELSKKAILGFVLFAISTGFFNKVQNFHLSFLQYIQLFLCHLLIYKAVLAI